MSSYWCTPNDLQDDAIDSVYKCFLMNSRVRDFTIQIQCENRIFPLNMTKNEVRLKICQNESSTKLSACYEKLGMKIEDEVVDRMSRIRVLQQVKKLITLTVSSFTVIIILQFDELLAELHEELVEPVDRKDGRLMRKKIDGVRILRSDYCL